MEKQAFIASLTAGGCAGMCVDLALFPLDTMKTRLQSQQGFYKAGGFRGIYAGVPSAAIGSFPNAAAFFVTYDCTKSLLGRGQDAARMAPVNHMLAASLGEVVACLIRVPTEVVKQRTQASPSSTTYQMLLATLREEGVRGLYRGYRSTVLREVGSLHTVTRCIHSFTHSLTSCSPLLISSGQCIRLYPFTLIHIQCLCGRLQPSTHLPTLRHKPMQGLKCVPLKQW
ncbi:mitochondrial S-adenosylmethionine carrier protein [Gadus macrocephalus]|uniref:mitochondrial S-adenosylmethionine carrier protein n=1 Tax=Gadus macrocephalus TaxID=80720 RepID=UPI0028CB253A|nr:mitochondrial S-adenosylmethionine carrier protein [Gadus macrocephalus]